MKYCPEVGQYLTLKNVMGQFSTFNTIRGTEQYSWTVSMLKTVPRAVFDEGDGGRGRGRILCYTDQTRNLTLYYIIVTSSLVPVLPCVFMHAPHSTVKTSTVPDNV